MRDDRKEFKQYNTQPIPEALKASVGLESKLPKLPPIVSYDELKRRLEAQELVEPPVLVEGLLHKGEKMSLSGSSKARKTWLLIDLAQSLAGGLPWLGFKMSRPSAKVLYVNLELQEYFFADRCVKVEQAKGIKDISGKLDTQTLRGYCGDASSIIQELAQQIESIQYDAIILDPSYKLLGGRDENAAGDIANLLNEFEKLAVQTGAAVIFSAHYSKGNQSTKDPMDRTSGSGVWGRDPDTIMTITAHEKSDALTVDAIVRNFKPIDPFVIELNKYTFNRNDELDPSNLKKRAGVKKRERTPEEFAGIIPEEGVEPHLVNDLAARELGVTKTDVKDRLRPLAAKKGLIEQDALDGNKWKPTDKELERRLRATPGES